MRTSDTIGRGEPTHNLKGCPYLHHRLISLLSIVFMLVALPINAAPSVSPLVDAASGAIAQTPCVPRHCVYLPNISVPLGPVQVLSFSVFVMRDAPVPILSGRLLNTLPHDIYQVTLRVIRHLVSGSASVITHTIDVVFAGETMVFTVPGFRTEEGERDSVDVIGWTDRSDRAYRLATVTIQRVESTPPFTYIYGTVQNEHTRSLQDLKIKLNELYPASLSEYVPDILAPRAKVPFILRTEVSISSPPSVRAYGYLAP